MRTIKALLMVLPLSTSMITTSGCYHYPAYVQAAPPAPPYPEVVETIPVRPGETYFWVRGHWAWGHGGYAWIPGRWIERPTPVAVWVPGGWHHQHGGWYWVEGHWQT
jgi:hypothetical protein